MESSWVLAEGVGIGEGPVPYFRWARQSGKEGRDLGKHYLCHWQLAANAAGATEITR